MPFKAAFVRHLVCVSLALGASQTLVPAVRADGLPSVADKTTGFDRSRYMSPAEIQPGMKGYGRTVMSGTQISTFDFEVVSVMSNAYYAKQDVILVRCSGLNLEHSGIIGGMSGSPCFIKDDQGHDRMIGAVAYGWTFNKDPLCGVQPITQMIDVAGVRDPSHRPVPHNGGPATAPAAGDAAAKGSFDVGQLVARVWAKPINASSHFSIFNDDIDRYGVKKPANVMAAGLEPLKTPVMIAGAAHPQVLSYFKDLLTQFGMEPVASGGATATTRAEYSKIQLEPGSVLCIPLVSGDLSMDALGTCTEVAGDRVLGFGHAMDGRGWIELPLATGMVHTVVPSVMRSNKLGASLNTVGTLWGDESSGIFGTTGKTPSMIPMDVVVEDLRGKDKFHFNVASDQTMTASLISGAAMEAIYAHSEPPREHTIKYNVELEFGELGCYRESNVSSQEGAFGIGMSLLLPSTTLLNSPFGEARISRARVEVKIEEGAQSAEMAHVVLDRSAYKPGQTVNARIRWAHYRNGPTFTEETYGLKLPNDIEDGEYALMVTNTRGNLLALRQEKPHLFRAENLNELLDGFNRLSSWPDNKLFLRLAVSRPGLAVKKTELPDLPSYMRQIYNDANRPDVRPCGQSIVQEYEVPFVVEGAHALKVTVNRRADQ